MKIDNQETLVITRIAPSPTGYFHLGSARSALYNYLFARKHGGKFILRIEDTDRERSRKEYENDIIESLRWLSLSYDELYRQSERTDIYRKHIEALLSNDRAYVSKEESGEVIRLRNAGREITFEDVIRGTITFHTKELGDFIIAREIESPLYHLAVVIDDSEMNISHVIRGEDHISNTPRQILIQEALGFKRPIYAHIPLILSKGRSKLSKREGAASIQEYREDGYLPEALINYLAFLGWSPEDEREFFTLEELTEAFDISRIHHGGAAFDEQKLKWFNGEYIKKLGDEELKNLALPFLPPSTKALKDYSPDRFKKVMPILKERILVFSDVRELAKKGELDYYFSKPHYEKEGLLWKEDADMQNAKLHLQTILERIESIPTRTFTAESVKKAVWDYASEKGRGSVLWPMRYALSGKDKSPDPFTLAEIFGKEETVARLKDAVRHPYPSTR